MTILESLPLVLGASMKVSHVATEAAGPSFCYGTDPTAGTRNSGSVNILKPIYGGIAFFAVPGPAGSVRGAPPRPYDLRLHGAFIW